MARLTVNRKIQLNVSSCCECARTSQKLITPSSISSTPTLLYSSFQMSEFKKIDSKAQSFDGRFNKLGVNENYGFKPLRKAM